MQNDIANSIKTDRKSCGLFNVTTKAIRATLNSGGATLICKVQRGLTPTWRAYRTAPQWWIKFDNNPCASGPWTADSIRKFHAAN